MSETNYIFQIGFDKDGDVDFSISATFSDMPIEKMNEVRKMITVAIGTMEGMFRRGYGMNNQAAKTT